MRCSRGTHRGRVRTTLVAAIATTAMLVSACGSGGDSAPTSASGSSGASESASIDDAVAALDKTLGEGHVREHLANMVCESKPGVVDVLKQPDDINGATGVVPGSDHADVHGDHADVDMTLTVQWNGGAYTRDATVGFDLADGSWCLASAEMHGDRKPAS